jgi:hypothetical protein
MKVAADFRGQQNDRDADQERRHWILVASAHTFTPSPSKRGFPARSLSPKLRQLLAAVPKRSGGNAAKWTACRPL